MKMKKITIKLSVVLALTALTSCQQMDLMPKDQMAQSEYFNNKTELELFSNLCWCTFVREGGWCVLTKRQVKLHAPQSKKQN